MQSTLLNEVAREALLNARKIDYTVSDPLYEDMVDDLLPEDFKTLERAVHGGDLQTVLRYKKRILTYMGITALRKVAKTLHIPYIYNYDKIDLISRIKAQRDRRQKADNQPLHGG